MKSKGFEDLEVWQAGMELAKEVYRVALSLPPEEKFGLVSQLRRCSLSVPSNIAEGSARGSDKDFMRFVNIALGSAAELKTQIIFCYEMNWIKQDAFIVLKERINRLGRMLKGLHRGLAKKHGISDEEAA